MYICIDFDGTIVDHRFPQIGPPVDGALEAIKRFQALGAKIILFTMRSDGNKYGKVLSQAVEFLRNNGVSLFGVNNNPDQGAWSKSPKAYANVYIDDAAFGCPLIHPDGFWQPCVDWSVVGPSVERQLQLDKGAQDRVDITVKTTP